MTGEVHADFTGHVDSIPIQKRLRSASELLPAAFIPITLKSMPGNSHKPTSSPPFLCLCFHSCLQLSLPSSLPRLFCVPHLREKRVRKEGAKQVSSPFPTSRTIKALRTAIPRITRKPGRKTRKPLTYTQGVLNPSTSWTSLREMVHGRNARK